MKAKMISELAAAAVLLSMPLKLKAMTAVERQASALYHLQMFDESLLEGDNSRCPPQQCQVHFHRPLLPNWQRRKGMNTEAVDQSRWKD